MYRKFLMGETAVGVVCAVVEWVQRGTLSWCGYGMNMNEGDSEGSI